MKILHIADIHWRGLSRHQEYILSFKDLFSQAKKLKPDIIYVGGDIVHSKTQGISPELVENLVWWFNELAKIAPTHIILGNHDGLIHNKDRQDAITPIIEAINNEKIFLYKDSGVYPTGIPGFDWCVFSCFDEDNWNKVKPSENISIALFHGAVGGSLTDSDWNLEGEVSSGFFNKFDFTLLGDIHKKQFLNKKKTIAYCGSTIQQDYGEDVEKGFLFWDIRTRDDFDVDFYPVRNDYKFVTVDWRGDVDRTAKACQEYPRLSRFRINVPENNYITPAQSRSLQKALKKTKNASEVVFKNENSFSNKRIENKTISNLNLRDESFIKNLMRQYYSGSNISEEEWKELDSLIEKYLSEVTQDNLENRNIKWTLNKIKFDNTFCFGRWNEINLDKLPGIVGIFGNNARGKSSIIGTIAYSLFNSSDRGSIKNMHIVNSRRDRCKTESDITVNGTSYRVVRETIKKVSKGKVWAPTTLKLYQLDNCGNIVKNLEDEQRRKTEKILRDMIGNSEQFSMTSLASQGEMNVFIKEKATSRKNILSNFLDMSIFDKMNALAKEETNELRSESKMYSVLNDCESSIEKESNKLKYKKEDLERINNEKELLESEIENLTREVHKKSNYEFISLNEVENLSSKLNKLENSINKNQNLLDEKREEIFESEEKISKIDTFIEVFDIDDIKEKHETSKKLVKTLWDLEGSLKLEESELKSMEKSVKKLLEVPCGDTFPTCKFIKDSHRDKQKIEEKREKAIRMRTNVADLRKAYKKIEKEEYEKKIEKYNSIIKRKSEIISNISNNRVRIQTLKNDVDNLNAAYEKTQREYLDLKEKYDNQDLEDDISGIASLLETKKKKLKINDKERISKIKDIEALRINLEKLKTSKKKIEKLNNQLKIQDLFIQATSKRGIPVQIINSLLPKINNEIASILNGVVGFTVVLEADLESNSMDVFIDYGDSKRIIELGSGMEKMISSLAIRVALINISSLPKTSMLIIDEGFGSLDETNLESCGRLLQSLKKSFKNIIVISHIDAVKDIVDHTLDIAKHGIDSYVKSI